MGGHWKVLQSLLKWWHDAGGNDDVGDSGDDDGNGDDDAGGNEDDAVVLQN